MLGRPSLARVVAASLVTLTIGAASAQTPAPAPANDTDAPAGIDEVVVRGQRLGEVKDNLRLYIRDFIGEVVAIPAGRGFARWNRSVCIGVHNLDSGPAQYIVDRISALALEVGLEPGEPGCAPQVNIVFATNARETAAAMVDREPRIFMPIGGDSGMDLGRFALERFVESDRVVRWWHVSLPVDAHTGNAAVEVGKNCPELHCPPTVHTQGPSRIHSGTRDELRYVIIVVDATQIKGTTWQQLGDYLAVLSLAQIDPQTNPAAFDSILNLFTNPAAYSGLTDWDRTYVRALYEFNQERLPHLQANEIVSAIAAHELEDD